VVRLNERFHIARETHGYSLVEKTVVSDRKTGENKIGERKRYAGTVYQALQIFLDQCLGDNPGDCQGLRFQVQKAMSEIESARKEIRREFSQVVRVSRGKNDGR